MKKCFFDSPLWGSISAIISGIMTSLIYPLVSTNNYVCIVEGKTFDINQIPDPLLVTLGKMLLLLIVFGLLWIGIAFVPALWRKRFYYWKKKTYSNRDICQLIANNSNQLLAISECRKNAEYCFTAEIFWKLKLRDLSAIIQSLYRAFISDNARSQSRMKDYFRKSFQSVLGDQASMYQLVGLIDGIDLLLKEAESVTETENSDNLLNSDCHVLREKLDYLKGLTQ